MFLKNKYIIIATMAILSEYFHLLFTGYVHSEVINAAGNKYLVYMDDAVWYFVNTLFILTLIITMFVDVKRDNKEGKVIMANVIFWFLIEFKEQACFLFKINQDSIFINAGSWLQLSSIFFTMCFVLYTRIKSKYWEAFLCFLQHIHIFIRKKLGKKK